MDKMKEMFSWENIRYDISAGLVVFLVALPLCLGIALASGAPLFAGIIAGVVGGLVVSLVSGSNLSVSGPAAGLTVIVLDAIHQLKSFEIFLVAVVLAGIIQVVFSLLKAGSVANFFPLSVIKGMLAAIGIILILKQIPHAVGDDLDFIGDFNFFQWDHENTFSEIFHAVKRFHKGALLTSALSLAILILWERPFMKKVKIIPGPLVVVIVGIFLNNLYHILGHEYVITEEHMVNIPVIAGVDGLISNLRFPDFSMMMDKDVWLIAFILSAVATLESLLSVEAIDKLDTQRRTTPANRELFAQGVGNIVSGLIGGLPLTAVIVRGSANVNSGAKSKMSAFFHGVFLLVAVLLLAPVINMIPYASLAAILLVIGYKLTKISLFKDAYKRGWQQFIPFVATILAIVFTDLLKGILIGIVVSIYYILKVNAKNAYFYQLFEAEGERNKVVLLLAEEVSFLNKANIKTTLEKIPDGTDVIIDGTHSVHIDDDILDVIDDFKTNAQYRNIQLERINIKESYN